MRCNVKNEEAFSDVQKSGQSHLPNPGLLRQLTRPTTAHYVTPLSLLDVANHHEIARTSIFKTSTYAAPLAAMSNPLAEYLSAIDVRDAREKAHEEYINACKCYCWRILCFFRSECVAICHNAVLTVSRYQACRPYGSSKPARICRRGRRVCAHRIHQDRPPRHAQRKSFCSCSRRLFPLFTCANTLRTRLHPAHPR
jgi:hypothetical protein